MPTILNIDREGSPLYDAFTSTGLTAPDVLMDQPRTIFDDPDDSSDDNFYDQIAWFTSGQDALIDLQFYTDTSLSRSSISHRISDHYPLWVEFRV